MQAARAPRGRPRSQVSRAAILTATYDALIERGYDAMSIESVAAAAGSSKTTVYRWWSTKADLAVDAFFDAMSEELLLPQTEFARDDFHQQILALVDVLTGPRGRAFTAMLTGSRVDDGLARALDSRWLEPRQTWGIVRMNRAIDDGQTHPHVTCEPALAMLYGPIYAPLLFGREVPDGDRLAVLLECGLSSIFKASGAKSP